MSEKGITVLSLFDGMSCGAGKCIPDWIRQKGITSARKAIIMLDKDGNELATFPSLTQAQEKTQIAASSISAVCKNKRPSAGGFKWKYK